MSKVNPENIADGKHTSGVTQNGIEIDGCKYPGRPLPPVSQVTTAKEEKGVAVKCARQQTGQNRYAINSHVEAKKEFGPNN